MELFHGKCRHGVGGCGYCERHEYFVCVQSGILVSKIFDLQLLQRLDYNGREKKEFIVYSAQLLKCVKKGSWYLLLPDSL